MTDPMTTTPAAESLPFGRLSRYALAGAQTIVLIPDLRDYEPHLDELGALAESVRKHVAAKEARE